MIMSGPDDGLELSLQPGDTSQASNTQSTVFTIGRRETCDICIPFDTSVSRLHATITIDSAERITLTDEDSRNGTFMGRQRVKDVTRLEANALFRVGNTWLRIQSIVKEDV